MQKTKDFLEQNEKRLLFWLFVTGCLCLALHYWRGPFKKLKYEEDYYFIFQPIIPSNSIFSLVKPSCILHFIVFFVTLFEICVSYGSCSRKQGFNKLVLVRPSKTATHILSNELRKTCWPIQSRTHL